MRSMVEGPGRGKDCRQGGRHVLEDEHGRKPEDRDPPNGEPSVPHRIPRWTVTPVVRFAVHFDGEPRRRVVEVEHVATRRVLAAKLQPIRTAAELGPEDYLWKR